MLEQTIYNFQKRTKSGKVPRSLDFVVRISNSICGDNAQTIALGSAETRLKGITDCKKIIFAHGGMTRACNYSLKKERINASINIQDNRLFVLDEQLIEKEEKGAAGIINIKLDLADKKAKSPSKTRNRFFSKQRNLKDMVLVSAGPERKTLMDYIRNKQDSFLDKDPHNKLLKLEPLRKQEEDVIDYVNNKLLHIEKLTPTLRARDREMEERRMQSYMDSRLPHPLAKGKEESVILECKSEPVEIEMVEKVVSEKRIKESAVKRLEPELCNEYALSRKGFAGRKEFFVFGMSDRPQESINKIEMYRDFLWKINFTNSLFVEPLVEREESYKVFIGKGNNSMLVRGLMKRRFWWTIVDKPTEDANFAWSQLKIADYLGFQKGTQPQIKSIHSLSSNSLNSVVVSQAEDSQINNKSYRKKKHKSINDSDIDQRLQPTRNPPTDKIEAKDPHTKIFSQKEMSLWSKHMERYSKNESSIDEKTYLKRSWLLKCKEATKIESNENLHVSNHFITNTFIGNKKAMFYAMRKYYQLKKGNVFSVLPLTFHISKGIEDPEYQKFLIVFKQLEEEKAKDRSVRNIWIAKPGEFTNRGMGITVCASLDDVKLRLRGREKNANGSLRTFILQKYIEKPLLYNKRKFDIRHYMLITCVNGMFKGYWYEEGYLRTSSYEFSTKNYRDPQIHLTNDAIQKNNDSYGKYEKGNKLSYTDFQKYLDSSYKGRNFDFFNKMLPKMRDIASDAIRSSYFLLDSDRRANNFEIFGLDFMIDEEFNPWLIEINTNPCLQLGCPLLSTLIPGMVENALKIGLDPLFPPPYNWQAGKKYQLGDDPLLTNRFEMIFDEASEGERIQELFKNVEKIDKNMGEIEEEDEEFAEETGKEWDGEL